MISLAQQRAILKCLCELREDLGSEIVFLINLQTSEVVASTSMLDDERYTITMSLFVPYLLMHQRVMMLRDDVPEYKFLRHEMDQYSYYLGYGSAGWGVATLTPGRLMVGYATGKTMFCLKCIGDIVETQPGTRN